MTPAEKPPKSTEPQARALSSLASRFRGRMAVLALTSFAGAGLEAAFLVVLTTTLLAVTNGRDRITIPLVDVSTSLALSFAASGAALVLRLLLALLGARLSATLAALVTTDARHELAGAYLDTSWSVQQSEPAGRLQELLTSFVNRVNTTMTALTQGVTAGLSLAAFLVTGALVDPLTTGAAIVSLVVLAGILAPLRRRARSRSGDSARASLAFASSVSELGNLGQEMQTFGVQREFRVRIDDLAQRAAETGRQVQVISSALSPVYTFLAYMAILGGVAGLAATDYQDVASMGSVLLLMLRSLSYGQQLVNVSGQLAASRPFLEQVEETKTRYRDQRASNGPHHPAGSAHIEAHDLSYAYTPERPAIHGLSFRIAPGELVGVIGPSGSGKSTLAQILLGLRNPTHGSVTVSGTDLTTVDRSWWTQRAAFVPQEPRLFTGTVAENIRFFRSGLSDAEVVIAAERANIAPDVHRLPQGFDTHLGERGGMLSGGQKQRLAIARALVGGPEILILDEPTSALDGESERLIRETLSLLRGSTTIIIIAHRMSSLDMCDRIMVLEGGVLSDFRAPADLIHSSGFYRQAMQS